MNSIACAVDKTVFGDDHYHHQPLEYATALLLIQIAVSQSVRRLHHQLARKRLQTSTHCEASGCLHKSSCTVVNNLSNIVHTHIYRFSLASKLVVLVRVQISESAQIKWLPLNLIECCCYRADRHQFSSVQQCGDQLARSFVITSTSTTSQNVG